MAQDALPRSVPSEHPLALHTNAVPIHWLLQAHPTCPLSVGRWGRVSAALPGRTDNACARRARSLASAARGGAQRKPVPRNAHGRFLTKAERGGAAQAAGAGGPQQAAAGDNASAPGDEGAQQAGDGDKGGQQAAAKDAEGVEGVRGGKRSGGQEGGARTGRSKRRAAPARSVDEGEESEGDEGGQQAAAKDHPVLEDGGGIVGQKRSGGPEGGARATRSKGRAAPARFMDEGEQSEGEGDVSPGSSSQEVQPKGMGRKRKPAPGAAGQSKGARGRKRGRGAAQQAPKNAGTGGDEQAPKGASLRKRARKRAM